jgi:hypothetical protein
MIQVKCGSCGHLGDIEDFDSVFCNGPEDYQCPKRGAFFQRQVSETEKDFYSSVQLFRLIESKKALFAGQVESEGFLDRFFLFGERYIRVRKNLEKRTLQHTLLNRMESYKVTLELSTLKHANKKGA